MERSYDYAIVRLTPDEARSESLNIGIAVFRSKGLELHVGSLSKIRAISGALDFDDVRELLASLAAIDKALCQDKSLSAEQRKKELSHQGVISFSAIGTFIAQSDRAYLDRVSRLLGSYVDPEPAKRAPSRKRSALLTEMKSMFRKERVLAKKDEDIDSHRIVPSYNLDEGLVADLVLQNGKMHIVETVDINGGDDSIRKIVSNIGVSALVLEIARIRFGEACTSTRLVYNVPHDQERLTRPSLEAAASQGAELINWGAYAERQKFIHAMTSLAVPLTTGGGQRPKFVQGHFKKLNFN